MCCDRTWLQPPWDARIESLNIFEKVGSVLPVLSLTLWWCRKSSRSLGLLVLAWHGWRGVNEQSLFAWRRPGIYCWFDFYDKTLFCAVGAVWWNENFSPRLFFKILRFPWVRCVSMSSETILVEVFCRKITRKAVKRIFRPFFLWGDVAAINWNVMRFLVFWSVKFDLRDFCWFFHRYQLPVLFLL